MKKLSIKLKVTIWYTAFVAAVALLALGIIALFAGQMFRSEQEEELRGEVAEFVEELETMTRENFWQAMCLLLFPWTPH